jgi:hydrogenase maturation factor
VTAGRERCLTCSDEAVAARVGSVDGSEAIVAVGAATERVAIDLVPDARPGDLLLCHAGIALERLEEDG